MKLLPDTSAIIAGELTKAIREKKPEQVLIHRAALAELEAQANRGKETGLIGIEEIKRARKLAEEFGIKVEVVGGRPEYYHIARARTGEIDALIRNFAWEQGATLLTCDFVQAEVAKAMGIPTIYVELKRKAITRLEELFDTETMSIHLKEGTVPVAKKGKPGKWSFVQLAERKMSREEIKAIAKEVLEAVKVREDAFIEAGRSGSTIVQLGNCRVIITQPPLSDGWEITATHPIAKLEFEDYFLPKKLVERLEKAEGILIAGPPGHGKTTFAQALAEWYKKKGKVVKTLEAPRDMVLSEEITQYSKHRAEADELYDILLLSRPDYTIFDEMRTLKDFKLYADLRLAGIGMVGVIHATTALDAIQRLVGKIELGLIPSIVDTVIFLLGGEVSEVYDLVMRVKVPTGLRQADLARPVIEVRDFFTDKLCYEIYTFGEQTVVVAVRRKERREIEMEREIRKAIRERAEVEVLGRKAIVKVSKERAEKISPKVLKRIERRYGVSVEIHPQ